MLYISWRRLLCYYIYYLFYAFSRNFSEPEHSPVCPLSVNSGLNPDNKVPFYSYYCRHNRPYNTHKHLYYHVYFNDSLLPLLSRYSTSNVITTFLYPLCFRSVIKSKAFTYRSYLVTPSLTDLFLWYNLTYHFLLVLGWFDIPQNTFSVLVCIL